MSFCSKLEIHPTIFLVFETDRLVSLEIPKPDAVSSASVWGVLDLRRPACCFYVGVCSAGFLNLWSTNIHLLFSSQVLSAHRPEPLPSMVLPLSPTIGFMVVSTMRLVEVRLVALEA